MFQKPAALAGVLVLMGCASLDDPVEPVRSGDSLGGTVIPPDSAETSRDFTDPEFADPGPALPLNPLPLPPDAAPPKTGSYEIGSLAPEGRPCIEARLALVRDAGADAGGASGNGGDAALGEGEGTAELGENGTSLGGEWGVDFGTGDLTVLVIFDKSGSMSTLWDQRTKWEVANDAFEKGLAGILDVVTIGAILFPQPGGCEVAPLDSELQFGFSSGRAFWTRWEQTAATRVPDGSTPLERAFRTADQAIEGACQRGLLDQRFRVLLVTDGEPTCGDDLQRIVGLSAEWGLIGIEVRVLGLPGSSSAADLLNAIANGGGTIEHQVVETAAELDDSVYQALR